MNIHAINQHKIAVKIVQDVIKQYDGVFNPTEEFDSKLMADHIIKNLKRNKIVKTYGE